jgi:ribosomal protein S18 acetylase RimI-like enzyme
LVSFSLEGPLLGQSAVCAVIFPALSDWFGVENAVRHYIDTVNDLPTIVARMSGQPVGFLSVKQHFPGAAEVYVLGVLPAYHRLGIGRAMLHVAEDYLRGLGVTYLQVKTLGPSHPDPGYAATRAFYDAVGFCPLEEFHQLWDANNPCLIMVKRL